MLRTVLALWLSSRPGEYDAVVPLARRDGHGGSGLADVYQSPPLRRVASELPDGGLGVDGGRQAAADGDRAAGPLRWTWTASAERLQALLQLSRGGRAHIKNQSTRKRFVRGQMEASCGTLS
jgi:hypothetical protein